MKTFIAHVCTGLFLALMGCGGGGGGGGSGAQPLATQEGSPPESPPPQSPPPSIDSPVGIWDGTGLNDRELVALVLDTGEYFVIYTTTGNSSLIGGLVQGNGAVSGRQISSSNGLDFNFEGAGVIPGKLDATVELQASLNGIVTADSEPSSPRNFTSMFNSLYNWTPSLENVAGNYDGQLGSEAGAELVRVDISNAGDILATGSSGCVATGTIKPHPSGNVYDIQISFGSSPCGLPNQTVAGAGSYDPNTNLLTLGLVDSGRNFGAVFSGSKGGAMDNDSDGLFNFQDTDDDNDGMLDVDDKCPLDPRLSCPLITDTIVADGKEWVQISLFTNLSWIDINAACPVDSGGTCSGILKGSDNRGYDMNGWTWASTEELRALFDFYGFEPPSAGEPFSQVMGEAAIEAWIAAGWLPTSADGDWNGHVVHFYEGRIREPLNDDISLGPYSTSGIVTFDNSHQSGTATTASHDYEDSNRPIWWKGGWFYRSP